MEGIHAFYFEDIRYVNLINLVIWTLGTLFAKICEIITAFQLDNGTYVQ